VRRKSIIREFVSVLLLVIFTLAVAPKQLLHDAITSHTHHFSKPSQQSHLHTYNFICDCENLVAESPFMDLTEPFSFYIKPDYSVFVSHFSFSFGYTHLESFRLRGPPSLV